MKLRPSRRDVLRAAGVGAAGLALACRHRVRALPVDDQHAAAILEPEPDSFVVAIWSSIAHGVALEVRDGGEVVHAATCAIEDTHAAVAISGLAPSTSYQVTITADTGVVLEHRVRTAPRRDDPRPVRIAVSADCDPSPEFASDLLAHLVAAEPELFVSIGDFPYTDNGPPATTVAEYRARHAQLRTTPRVRALLQATGMRAIYDDHEFRNDWNASFVAEEPARYAAAMRVWDEFFPLPAAAPEIRYRKWRWGAHLECFLLDTRRFRSANTAPDDAGKVMIGARQRGWLVDGVARSTATFKLIFTTVPLDFGTGNDHWASFTTERDAMFAAVANVPGVVFVSGDQHFFAAHRHAYGLREFQVGPLARGLGTPGPAAGGVVFRDVRYNFGLLDVDGDRLTISGVGADGNVFYKETLTPRRA